MDAVKKVLYISYDGMTDPLGRAQVLPYLQNLAKLGYHFTVLSFEKPAQFKKDRNEIENITTRAGINWVPMTFTATPPVVSKMWDRYRMWQTAVQLHRKNRFDLIHCRSYVAAEVGLKLKQRFGVKFLFDMRGFWADEKVDNGQWNMHHPLYRFLYKQYKKKERNFLLHADGIISLTQAAKDYLLQRPAYKRLTIDVIPCCADLEHFDYRNITVEQQCELRKKWNLSPDSKLLTYLGSVGGWYMTKEMFLFFKQLKQKYPEYKMLILTKDDPERVQKEAASMDVAAEQLIVTYADRRVLPIFLSISTLSIFFIRNSFSKTASSPTKHAELMGMGVPVVCNDIGDTGRIVEQTGTGLLVNEFTPQSFASAIVQLAKLTTINKEHIRRNAIERFDLHSGVATYQQVYERLVGKKQSKHNAAC